MLAVKLYCVSGFCINIEDALCLHVLAKECDLQVGDHHMYRRRRYSILRSCPKYLQEVTSVKAVDNLNNNLKMQLQTNSEVFP